MSSIFFALFALLLEPAPARSAEILAAAAASLAPLKDDLASEFQRVSGHQVRFVFHSSGMLARQIANGAPYDVYLSANQRYVRQLLDSGDLLPETLRLYAYGRLGLWAPEGGVRTLEDLAAPAVRRLAMPNPAHAPYGVAARQALKRRGLWERLKPKIVLGENVRQAFQYAESGNVDAVLTAWTFVARRGAVLVPEKWHEPIRQTGAVVSRSARREAAERFLGFLLGEEGRRILEKHGLFPPDRPGAGR